MSRNLDWISGLYAVKSMAKMCLLNSLISWLVNPIFEERSLLRNWLDIIAEQEAIPTAAPTERLKFLVAITTALSGKRVCAYPHHWDGFGEKPKLQTQAQQPESKAWNNNKVIMLETGNQDSRDRTAERLNNHHRKQQTRGLVGAPSSHQLEVQRHEVHVSEEHHAE
ncbi:hypothetical protein OGATHE_003023 [Ogataea polymorpha]|uniref:Uncharacterized protein n=1 Tax=Ogataea polymorpha TaxID=460523 RepID=A0A9P8PER7_9ASCO|nr:hypothetical protein OGATHE_003023 [Ogataea polymorpha]